MRLNAMKPAFGSTYTFNPKTVKEPAGKELKEHQPYLENATLCEKVAMDKGLIVVDNRFNSFIETILTCNGVDFKKSD